MKRTFTQLFLFLLLFSFVSANAQQSSESHNFITYDTTYNVGYAGLAFILRITRPANLFTANNPDTASRPGIIMMGGVGEIGTNPGLTAVNGPHYWLAHGWDGGVTLGNGKHYPIIISVQAYQAWPQTRELLMILTHILKTYHIKRNSVHLTGLSMGAFGWTALICHQSTPGAEDGMKLVTSIAALEGQSTGVSASVVANELPGYTSFGVWAQKYKGKFFGLEGVADWRNVAAVSKAMNEKAPGSAYFSYQNIGGGYHCCWNSMYDPSATNWTSVGKLGPNNARSTDPNTMGTYNGASSIFQWMIRQGDTSMVASNNNNNGNGNNNPTANAGTDQTITLPTNSLNLSGSGSDADGKKPKSYSWRSINGPSQYTISNSNDANPVLSNLVAGIYTFRLTVTDKAGATAYDDINITVIAAPANKTPVVNAGTDQTLTLPANSLTLNGSGTDPDGKKIKSYSWKSINGPSQYTISNNKIPNPVVSNLTAGTYTFRLTVTDDNDAAGYNDVNITVKTSPANHAPVANAGADQIITLPANSLTLNGSGTDPEGKKIKSYSWKSINGPSQYTISNSNIPNPVLSNLIAGTYTFRFTVTDNAGATAYDDININVNAALVSSSPKTIPGRIQAENYDAMNGVLTQSTTDVNGGKNIEYFTNGSWMNYNVKVVTAGTYTVSFRVATPNSNTGFQLRNATGKVMATIKLIKSTGGYQSWQTVSTTVILPAGNQTLQLFSTTTPYLNINWMEFIGTAAQPVPAPVPTPVSGKLIPGRITGASYDKMNGVVVQASSDANGGQNLGWIGNGSWMNYNVTVAAAGTYKVSFRVATPNNGVSFQLKIGNGTVLTTLYPGSTGGYQTWQTISTTVSLPSGSQTIGIYSSSNPMWNFNWMEFTNTKATAQANTSQTSTVSAQMLTADTVAEAFHTGSSFTIYPNPVKNNLSIDINNSHMGKMNVSVINQSGNIIKTYSLIKDQTFTHLNLASDYLSTGTYFIRVQIGSWTEIRKLLKL